MAPHNGQQPDNSPLMPDNSAQRDMPLYVRLFGAHAPSHYVALAIASAAIALIIGYWISLLSPEFRLPAALYGFIVVSIIPLLGMLDSPDRRVKLATMAVIAGEGWAILTRDVVIGLIAVPVTYVVLLGLETVVSCAQADRANGPVSQRPTAITKVVAASTAAWSLLAVPAMLAAHRHLTQQNTSTESATLVIGGVFTVLLLISIYQVLKERTQPAVM